MSEWKNKLDNEVNDSYYNESRCTGWGIIDGVIACINSIKRRRRKRKQQKIQLKNLTE
jgi:hypothetical protein